MLVSVESKKTHDRETKKGAGGRFCSNDDFNQQTPTNVPLDACNACIGLRTSLSEGHGGAAKGKEEKGEPHCRRIFL
jgi:hypothetical protein